ncbi:MAG: pantoate--beta-alanine ligase [Phocaeicola sp.]
MELLHTVKELQATLDAYRAEGKKIGLVPTMGALHEGHTSLVERATSENDVVVVTIFVNPTQFNDSNDLLKYPRTLEADCLLLEKTGATVIFAPSVEEVYPKTDTRLFSYPPLDTVMEGKFRAGHFNGVCQVVSKLFLMVNPDTAYFGEKDYQQLAIIREMTKQLQLPIHIVGCPIIREADGLAMSSRNRRLSAEERECALQISQSLFKSRNLIESHTVSETKQFVEESINRSTGLTLEYFEIVDGYTLQPLTNWEEATSVVGCVAAFCGDIRLIDNIKYKDKE